MTSAQKDEKDEKDELIVRLKEECRTLAQKIKSRLAELQRDIACHDSCEIGGRKVAVSHEGTVDSELISTDTEKIYLIRAALKRLEDGTYGVCECGEYIDSRRLKALPYATLCIECQRRQEEFGE